MKTNTALELCNMLQPTIGRVAAIAFDHSPVPFLDLYRPRVREFQGSFRKIEMVPKALLLKRVEKDGETIQKVATAILRNWFDARKELRDKTATMLKTLGYQVYQPDFENDSVAHNSLLPSHVLVEEKASYFAPEGAEGAFDGLGPIKVSPSNGRLQTIHQYAEDQKKHLNEKKLLKTHTSLSSYLDLGDLYDILTQTPDGSLHPELQQFYTTIGGLFPEKTNLKGMLQKLKDIRNPVAHNNLIAEVTISELEAVVKNIHKALIT